MSIRTDQEMAQDDDGCLPHSLRGGWYRVGSYKHGGARCGRSAADLRSHNDALFLAKARLIAGTKKGRRSKVQLRMDTSAGLDPLRVAEVRLRLRAGWWCRPSTPRAGYHFHVGMSVALQTSRTQPSVDAKMLMAMASERESDELPSVAIHAGPSTNSIAQTAFLRRTLPACIPGHLRPCYADNTMV
jgi:hypothetical protein